MDKLMIGTINEKDGVKVLLELSFVALLFGIDVYIQSHVSRHK